MKETKTKKLVLSAVLLALATVLSLFKVYHSCRWAAPLRC